MKFIPMKTNLKRVTSICLCLLLIALSAPLTIIGSAEDADMMPLVGASEDTITSYGDATGTVIIGGTGVVNFFAPYYLFDGHTVSVKKVVFQDGITGLGNSLFYDSHFNDPTTSFGDLKEVVIPSTMKYIGGDAFIGCGSLEIVHVSDIEAWCDIEFENSRSNPLSITHTMYHNNKPVTDLIIPEGTKRISERAFYGCTSLQSVSIPNSVTSIETRAFYGCTGLTSLSIPNSITTLPDNAFGNCSGLTSVSIPPSVTSIGFAFSGCDSLEEIHIADLAAWCEMDWIDSSISDFGETIKFFVSGNPGGKLFLNDELLTELVIPENVTSISDGAFNLCDSLESVIIPDHVTSIGSFSFSGCSNLTSISLSKNLTNIGVGSFSFCPALTTVEFKEGVKNIGDFSFSYCSSLASVEFPKGVENIGDNAFFDCTGLETLKIPNTLKYVGRLAFYDCSALKSVYYHGKKLQWEQIEIKEGNDCLKRAKRNYTSSTVTIFDPTNRFKLVYDEDAFDGDVTFSVTEAANPNGYLEKDYGKAAAWEMRFLLNGETVQPRTPATLYIPVPSGFNTGKIAAFYVDENGVAKKITSKSIVNGMISLSITSSGIFVVVDESTEQVNNPEPDPSTQPTENPSAQQGDEKNDSAPKLNFFERIIQWFRNLFAKLFKK